jgi:hypothetical protein
MLDAESKYIGRELEDYLLQSTSELRERLAKLKTLIATAEEELQAAFGRLADRERLALRCMFARDCWHMAALYKSYIASASLTAAEALTSSGPSSPAVEEIDEAAEPVPILPFKETLFG